MLYLHQYPPVWGLPSLSPFCIKVETYLRMVKLPYQIQLENNPRKGPKGKMPVLRDGDVTIPDSSFIITYLQEKYGNLLDADLSAEQQALAHAVRKMVEENLYFVILYARWIDPVGKKAVDQEYRRFFPPLLAPLALRWIRNNLRKQAYLQGIGRHSLEEIYKIGSDDIAALSELMGTDPFMLGDKPHTIDATVYAFLITILQGAFESPLQDTLRKHENLLRYCERMKKLYFNE